MEVHEKWSEGHMRWILIAEAIVMEHKDWMVAEDLDRTLAVEVVRCWAAKVVPLMWERRQQEHIDSGHLGHAMGEP